MTISDHIPGFLCLGIRSLFFVGFLEQKRSGAMLFSGVIKDNSVFNRCFRSGRFCTAPFLAAYYLPNGTAENRVGISVSKKIGNAVCRNRAKRIIRAAYRLSEKSFPVGFDIVFAVRPAVNGLKTQDIEAFLTGRLIKDMNSSFDENGEFIGRKKKKADHAGSGNGLDKKGV